MQSDLLKGIPKDKKYGLITIAPPTNADETEWQRGIKNTIKDILPGILRRPLEGLFQRLHQKERRGWLQQFIQEAKNHLNDEGILLLNVLSADAKYLEKQMPGHTQKRKTTGNTTVIAVK